ncbi:hypothetical protein L1887_22527 [Cichorium endivia]|nr:hypothetical protein L1887_22527 [Cichorium endivia]
MLFDVLTSSRGSALLGPIDLAISLVGSCCITLGTKKDTFVLALLKIISCQQKLYYSVIQEVQGSNPDTSKISQCLVEHLTSKETLLVLCISPRGR